LDTKKEVLSILDEVLNLGGASAQFDLELLGALPDLDSWRGGLPTCSSERDGSSSSDDEIDGSTRPRLASLVDLSRQAGLVHRRWPGWGVAMSPGCPPSLWFIVFEIFSGGGDV
jgi:hypothetical protein